MRPSIGSMALLALSAPSCRKVPIFDVDAGFVLADASWFAEEETLFLFAEVHAEQGISDLSVLEVTYLTDDEELPWTPLSELPMVHTHVPADCGPNTLCGSASLHVPSEPREVALRMRYHRDGALSLGAETVFNTVAAGPAHTNRSLIVYGVFDELNQRIQWRGRHQLPTLRNQRAGALGLRRDITITEQRSGTRELASPLNPYGYGVDCPETFAATGLPELWTNERARFNAEALPLSAADDPVVCATATVTDATGTFSTGAIARKNPEVRAAFPSLRSPAHDATPLQFFLGPCDRTISAEHEAMQRQRLLIGPDVPTTCTEGWRQPGFVEQLVVTFRDAVEDERRTGNDMVLVIALNQDEIGLSEAVEEALLQVAPGERLRGSPRLAGAFVLDSTAHGLSLEELSPVTLWCPSTVPFDQIPDLSARTCAIEPDIPDFELGPFSFGSLPILPSREQYLDFIDTYSPNQAGSVQSLAFRTPEFATTATHVDVGGFGAATFLNNERISADPDDAFSYCVAEDPQLVVFRSGLLDNPLLGQLIAQGCAQLGLPEEICASAILGISPLQWLPDWHNVFGEDTYELGIFWEFPFLLRMDYELVQAGSVSAFGLSVPFGIASPGESYYGTELWTLDEIPLGEVLLQCTRFCDHPTFDSAGVYHVTDPFRTSYAHNCYLPAYPQLGDTGSPRDP
ncbi:MAG TPA: hypothetical protein ENK18_15765 [Deltaproteobacteria bacterium]|nr:hypothetical protein [Deltaproteobacteria bacterium]